MKKVYFMLSVCVCFLTFIACSNDDFDVRSETSHNKEQTSRMTPHTRGLSSELPADCQAEANRINRLIIERLCPQTKTTGLVLDTDRDYPDFWGGSYITPSGNLVVLFSGDSLVCVKNIEAIVKSDICQYKRCTYSYKELLKIMEDIATHIDSAPIHLKSNVCGYGIIEDGNYVEISLVHMDDDAINEFKQMYNHPALRFIESGKFVEESTQLNPGGYLTVITGGHGSYAFRARETTGNRRVGMVTSGHVLQTGDHAYINGQIIGTCSISQNSGSVDAAFVPVNTTLCEPSNTIVGTLNELSTTTSLPGVGTFVNMRGSSTGSSGHGGRIVSTNYSYIYMDESTNISTTYTNMTTAEYSSQYGDSGGIIYTYISSTETRYTVGVHRGTTPTSGVKVFTKANLALSALNVERY